MTWSPDAFSNSLPQSEWEAAFDHKVPAYMMVALLVIVIMYPLHDKLLLRVGGENYHQMESEKQVVVLQHAVEATVLTLSFVPMTFLILRLNFEDDYDSFDQFARTMRMTGTFMFGIIMMYMIELAMRFRHLRPLVAIHHLCAYGNSVFPAFLLTTANLRASSVLVYMIHFEAITFMGLVLYRLAPDSKHTPRVVLTGMVVFGVTRPLQLLWIVGALGATWESIVQWQAIVQILLSVLFTVLQAYSLKIHYTIYHKLTAVPDKQRGEPHPADVVAVDVEQASRNVDTDDLQKETTTSSSETGQDDS